MKFIVPILIRKKKHLNTEYTIPSNHAANDSDLYIFTF